MNFASYCSYYTTLNYGCVIDSEGGRLYSKGGCSSGIHRDVKSSKSDEVWEGMSQPAESPNTACTHEALFDVFLTLHHIIDFFSSYQLNAHFFYSITIYMLHYNPQHVSSSTFLIFRRTKFIITAFGIVNLCKQPYNMSVESGLIPFSTGILYGCLQRVTIPKAVIIQFVLLKIRKVLLETCWVL